MAPIIVTFATEDGVASLQQVEASARISTLLPALAAALGLPAGEAALLFNNAPVADGATFAGAGVSDGDLVLVVRRAAAAAPAAPAADGGGGGVPVGGDGGGGGVPVGGDGAPLDPMSLEYQKAMEERIRMENVMENYSNAVERNPESFGQVTMLFIDAKLNGKPVCVFVDSGAQTTIISKAAAERCDILRLLDTRFHGIARGVGTAKIHGRIHLALMDIAGQVFEVSLTVMEDATYDMLLGLDMLRRHQATLDLTSNSLSIGEARTEFLPEHRIPLAFRQPGGDPSSASPEGDAAGRTTGGDQAANAGAAAEDAAAGRAQAAGRSTPNARPAPLPGGNAPAAADPQKVARLEALGFSKPDIEQALANFNGNEEQAASFLASAKYGI